MSPEDAREFIARLYGLMRTMVPENEIDSLSELQKYDRESRNAAHLNKINFFGVYSSLDELIGFGCRSALENGGGFTVYAGVKPEYRGAREIQTPYASALFQSMNDWARSLQPGKSINFIEMEPPVHETAIKRIPSFERLGFAAIDIPVYAYRSPSTDALGYGEDGCSGSWLGVAPATLPEGVLKRDDFLRMTADLHNQLNGTRISLPDFEGERRYALPPHLRMMAEDTEGQSTLRLKTFTDAIRAFTAGNRTLAPGGPASGL